MTDLGKNFFGIPVRVSEYVPKDTGWMLIPRYKMTFIHRPDAEPDEVELLVTSEFKEKLLTLKFVEEEGND
jgi:hypothetical protein